MSQGERKLAAIMYTDIVGYTSLTQKDESYTLQALEKHRSLLRPHFASHGGREIKTIGDAFLVEFQSALDAVLCAVAVQQTMHGRKVATGDTISLRIGIHVGDVVESGNDILGDTVNIASRIEPLAEPGGVCISDEVYKQVRNKSDLPFVPLGEKSLKNVSAPVAVYKVRMPWEQSAAIAETPTFATNRIAILPFTSFSLDPNDAFFADGVTDEIISAVAGISGLSVISRTSVIGYKGTSKKVKEIGRELEVGSILEGTFKKAGNRIRVTTQLIDVAQDKHLWAQNYDRNLDDVFEVQSDVAKQVAEALRVRILAPEKERIESKPTESTAAYTLYLKGRSLWNARGLEDLKKAKEYLELAVHEDPGFALGYVGVSDCCAVLRNNWGFEPEANLAEAKAMVGKALEIDHLLAEAHASKGLLLRQEYDLRAAEEEFRRAIELKPGYAMAHLWYHLLLVTQVRLDEAQEQIEKALELDPMAPVIHWDHGSYWRLRGDHDKAITSFMRAVELGFPIAHFELGFTYGLMKRFDDMKREYAAYVEAGKSSIPLAHVFAESEEAYLTDNKETARRLLPQIEASFEGERGFNAYYIGRYLFYLGERDKAFEWLERSYSNREADLPMVKCDQILGHFRGIQSDPRYLDLVKRLGLG